MPKTPQSKKTVATKRKMQNVDFSSVDELLDFLPEDELKIVQLLRKLVFHCIPDVEEKISFNVPFYKRHFNICYIWPSSVLWGNVKNTGVQFGFNKGYLMSDEINYLEKGNRKQVYWKTYHSIAEIDTELLKSYIFEAAFVDEEVSRSKKKRK